MITYVHNTRVYEEWLEVCVSERKEVKLDEEHIKVMWYIRIAKQKQ